MAGAAGVDLEVVAAAAAVDTIAVLTEVGGVDQEEEEAWGKCLNTMQCPCYQSCPMSPGLMRAQ